MANLDYRLTLPIDNFYEYLIKSNLGFLTGKESSSSCENLKGCY